MANPKISGGIIIDNPGQSSGSNNTPKLSLSFSNFTNNRQFSVYRNGATSRPQMTDVDCSGVSFDMRFEIENRGVHADTQAKFKKIELYVGNTKVTEVTFRQRINNVFENYILIQNSNDYYSGTFNIDLTQTGFQSFTYMFDLISQNTTHTPAHITNSGTYTVNAVASYSVRYGGYEYEYAQEYQIGTFEIQPFKLSFILLDSNQCPKLYLLNDTFSHSGLQVFAAFEYFNKEFAFQETIQNYSISQPDMTTAGVKTVYVNYSGKTNNYNIGVYTYDHVTDLEVLSIRNTNIFRQGETYIPQQVRVEYGAITVGYDSRYEMVNVIETKPVDTTIETSSGEWKGYIIEPRMGLRIDLPTKTYHVASLKRLNINTDNAKTSYYLNEQFNNNGLNITASYGVGSDYNCAGTDSIPLGSCTFNFPSLLNSDIGKTKQVAVSYEDDFKRITNTYNIFVNGITDVRGSFEQIETFVRKPFSVNNYSCQVKRSINGVVSDWQNFTLTQTNHTLTYNVDLNEVGTYKTILTINENGQSGSCEDFNIKVFDVHTFNGGIVNEAFVSESNGTIIFNQENFGSIFNFRPFYVFKFKDLSGNITYRQVFFNITDDNISIINPQIETPLSVGEYQVTFYDNYYEQTFDFATIRVTHNTFATNQNIMVEGGLTKTLYSVGEQLLLNGLTFKTKLLNGEMGIIPLTSIQATIVGKDSLTMTSEDLGQEYFVTISAPTITDKTVMLSQRIKVDGLRGITNIQCSKTTYFVGETFDIRTITYKCLYYFSEDNSIHTEDISTPVNTPFSMDNSDVVNVPITIKDTTTTIAISVKKPISLAINTNGNTNFNRLDSIDIANYSFEITYNDNTKKVLTSEEKSLLTHTFKNIDEAAISNCSLTSLEAPDILNNDIVKWAISYTIHGVTLSTQTTIHVRKLQSIELYDNVLHQVIEGFNFKQNDRFSLSGNVVIKVIYNNKIDYLPLGTTGTTISPTLNSTFDNATTYQCSIGFTAYGITKSYNAPIYIEYRAIPTSNLASLTTGSYFVGGTLDLSGIQVQQQVLSTNAEDNTYPKTEILSDFTIYIDNIEYTQGFILATSGTKAIRVTINGYTLTHQFEVQDVQIANAEAVFGSGFKALNSYIDGQTLSLNGLSLHITYNNGSQDYIDVSSPSVELVDSDSNQIAKTTRISTTLHNNVQLYLNYKDQIVTIGTLVVIPKVCTSIEIINLPSKTTYTYGDLFSLSGLNVKAYFNDMSSRLLSATEINVVGYENGHLFLPTNAEDMIPNSSISRVTEMVVEYQEVGSTKQTATFNVNVIRPTIKTISTNALSSAVKTKYINGENFSNNGLIITATMENGWEITIPSSNYVIDTTSLNLDNEGKIQANHVYGNKVIVLTITNPYNPSNIITSSYNVEVATTGQIISASIHFEDGVEYNKYYVGDKYNAKGVYLMLTDIDNNQFPTYDFITSVVRGTTLNRATKKIIDISYSNKDFAVHFEYEIVVYVPNKEETTITNDYKIVFGLENGTLITSIAREETIIKIGSNAKCYPLFKKDFVQIDNNPLHTETYQRNIYVGNDLNGDCIGYVDFGYEEGGEKVKNAHVVLFEDAKNPISGQGNIIVTFPHYVTDLADRINNATIGKIFNNRLFVSGNKNFANCDWHSSAINTTQAENYNNIAKHDFTYFSDLDYCYYGDSSTPVVGYDIYKDGELVVFKTGSQNQATMYRRIIKLTTPMAYDGMNIEGDNLSEEQFPMFDINSNGGIGALTSKGIVNFAGDTIVLTKDGLKEITTKSNVYGNYKYSRDISNNINYKITKEDLKNAQLHVFDDKLLLKTNRGIYVSYSKLKSEDGNYEWYFLDNISSDYFFEIDDEIYFADNKGNFNRLPKDNIFFEDKVRTYIGIGGTTLTVDENANAFVVTNANYSENIQTGKDFHLISTYIQNVGNRRVKTYVHASLGYFMEKEILKLPNTDKTYCSGIIDTDNNTIEIACFYENGNKDVMKTLNIIDHYYENREIYFDIISGINCKISVGTTYYLRRYNEDIGSNIYQIVDSLDNIVDLSGIETMRMSFPIKESMNSTIGEILEENQSGAKMFKVIGEHGKELKLINYEMNGNISYEAIITSKENVKAYYITTPYDMGSYAYKKTIWQWVIANDTSLASYIDIAYLTSRKQGDYEAVIKSTDGTRQLNFEQVVFDRIQFLNDKLPHVYSKQRTLPNINFIRFMFKNNENTNMALTSLEVIYTISELTKGAK